MISMLIQGALLVSVLCLALAAGAGLAGLFGVRTRPALAVAAVATAILAGGLWLFVRDAFRQIETDEAGVATVATAVVSTIWLTGLAAGYGIVRRRA